MTDDVWAGLRRPTKGKIEARRVDRKRRNDFFWTRHPDGRVGLSLFHSSPFPPDLKLPRMHGLELKRHEATDGSLGIHWILGDPLAPELFTELCRDIVASAGDETPEDPAIRKAVNRTWRWHRLLRAGGDGPLNAEEQKGLIAELSVLAMLIEKDLLGPGIEAWRGPLAEPKDFIVSEAGIEVKAPRGADDDQLHISSEDQLDMSGLVSLFLVVWPVERPTEAGPDSMTLQEFAERAVSQVEQRLPNEMALLEGRLMAAGFDWDHDYSEHRWDLGEPRVFQVQSGFPALSRADLPGGIHSVTYRISLASIGLWRIPLEAFLQHVRQEL